MTSLKRKPSTKELEAGEYTAVLDHDTWCYCKCPKCGKLTKIIRTHHDINYLGELYPKVTCPYKCGFSGDMMLEEWIPEAKGSA